MFGLEIYARGLGPATSRTPKRLTCHLSQAVTLPFRTGRSRLGCSLDACDDRPEAIWTGVASKDYCSTSNHRPDHLPNLRRGGLFCGPLLEVFRSGAWPSD